MNDRVSNKPPSLYTNEEDAMGQYVAQSRTAQPTQNRKASGDGVGADYDAGIESSKSSGMSRLGRALVNALKPVSGWRGFGGLRDGKEQSTNAEKSVLQARQLKAEKEYAELKKSGFVGTQVALTAPTPTPIPTIRYEDTFDENRRAPHRDSGIDIDGYSSSSEQKRDSRVSNPAEGALPLQQIPDRAATSLSQVSSARRSSLHFRKPSLQTLKKVKSQVQLPSSAHQAPELGVGFSHDCDKSKEGDEIERSPRKQPSRRDIAKQQRLSKKVSDLETQLEIARRNLKFSMSNESVDPSGIPQKGGLSASPQKTLKPFIPGALPSLPSERILKGYVSHENGHQGDGTGSNQNPTKTCIRKAAKDSTTVEGAVTSDSAGGLSQEFQAPVQKQSRPKKRKSDGDEDVRYKPVGHGNDEAGGDPAKRPRLRRSKRQMKEVEVSETKQRKPVSRVPKNSPLKNEDPLPPLPPALTSLNPASIDQAKILSMRSANNTKTPFGKHIEDIANLRKEFPTVTEAQWADYLGDLPKDSKMTDHTSISHHDQPAMSVLGRPRSVSPVKAKAPEVPDHPFSTPNQESPLRLLPRIEDEEEVETDSVASFSAVHDLVSERTSSLHSSRRGRTLEALKVTAEKPLPGIQKEDYEWPEDVF